MVTAADMPGFPADLAADFDEATDRIAAIQSQMDALRDELRPLIAQREAAIDLYAETTDDPAALLALSSGSTIAFRKVEAHIRSLHPYMYSYSQYHMSDVQPRDLDGNLKGDPVVLTGPHVSLMRHTRRPLTVEQAEPLADALIEFARAYTPNPVGLLPEWGMGDHTGMVQCDILTENDDTPTIWYTPDGTHAAYYANATNGMTGHSDPETGTLAAMLARAIRDAARPSDDDNDY